MKKLLLSIVLAICMVMALSSGTVFAENDIIASGECGAQGDNLTWTLDSEGVLTISGNGQMVGTSYPWHEHRSKIREIILSNGVTSIGNSAFFSCTQLVNVDIPSSVTKIEKNAFSFSGLASIMIPNSVSSIGDNAFSWCTNLHTIEIPSSVTDFGVGVLGNCENLMDVVIPDNMTTIPYDTFANCSSLSYVNIPSSVTQIGTYAFYNCNGLTGVSIPDSVTDIGSYAFCGCSKL